MNNEATYKITLLHQTWNDSVGMIDSPWVITIDDNGKVIYFAREIAKYL